MRKENTKEGYGSRVCWESLEEWLREGVQGLLQDVLEEEVSELLGRLRSQRRQVVDASPGYRNGYGKKRKLTLSCGTVRVRRPRVRGLEHRFESRILPLFARRTQQVNDLIPELTCTDWPKGTLTWRCAGCWGMRLRFRRAR